MEASGTADITGLLELWRRGDMAAFEAASSLLYGELHRIAQSYMRGSRGGATLQPTALVHEAYIRLTERSIGPFLDRKHFFALAAKVMRQILVDRARERAALKRGGEAVRHIPLDDGQPAVAADPDEFLLLDEALGRLTEHSRDLASVIELRYFAGLTLEETADILAVSVATANRRQRLAEAWLSRAVSGG